MNHPAQIQRDQRWHLAAGLLEGSLMQRHIPSEKGKA